MPRTFIATLLIALCACSPSSSGTNPSASPIATLQAKEAQSFLEVGGFPIASPDGKRVVVAPIGTDTKAILYERSGAKVGEIPGVVPSLFPTWLPDSSGVVVARGSRTEYTLDIVEPDLHITPTGLSGGSPSSLKPSPDGKVLAVETPEQVWTFTRANPSAVTPVAGTRGRQLVGWDAKGNILVREGNTIFTAIGQGAPRPLPDDLQTDRKVSFTFTTSPDRTVNVIGSTRDQGRSIYVSLAKIIDGYSPNAWVGAHQALVTHNGKHFVFDGATGDEQPVDLPERARVLAATERDIVWAEGDELHVTSTKGGQDRQIVGAQAREVNVTTLATDGLLIYSTLNKKAWLVDLQPR